MHSEVSTNDCSTYFYNDSSTFFLSQKKLLLSSLFYRAIGCLSFFYYYFFWNRNNCTLKIVISNYNEMFQTKWMLVYYAIKMPTKTDPSPFASFCHQNMLPAFVDLSFTPDTFPNCSHKSFIISPVSSTHQLTKEMHKIYDFMDYFELDSLHNL